LADNIPESGILKLDESCIQIRNLESDLLKLEGHCQSNLSDFGSEMQDSSNFKFFLIQLVEYAIPW
jgi:hypothetical protein